jgi:hypothetical protein
MNKFVRFFMFVTLACVAFSCGKDDDSEEPLKPLPTPFLELQSATESTQYLTGDAGSKTFTIATNRKFAATSDVSWLTVAVDVEAKTVTFTATKNELVQGTKPGKRTGSINIAALPERDDDVVTSAKLDVSVEQALFGLPEADMLNVVFNAQGAVDASPLATEILAPNTAPETKLNELYKRFTARFSGNRIDGGHNGDVFYQVPLYTTTVSWADLTQWQVDENAAGAYREPLPYSFNALGQAFERKNFTVEMIVSNKFLNPVTGDPLYGEQEYVSMQQSSGWGLGFEGGNADDGATFVFYYNPGDALDTPTPGAGGNIRFGIQPTVEGQPTVGAKPDVFYHVIVITDFTKHVITAYVDGQLVATRPFNETSVTTTLPNKGNKFANWIGLGADAANPPRRAEGVTDPVKQRAQYSSNGEMVLTRIYGKVLTPAEIDLLYLYEKPE